jgi:hypothetical protein
MLGSMWQSKAAASQPGSEREEEAGGRFPLLTLGQARHYLKHLEPGCHCQKKVEWGWNSGPYDTRDT